MVPDSSKSVELRPATERDAETLLEWRNDPLTRQMSKRPGRVGWEEHVDWLRDVLDNATCLLWIAEDHGEPVGRARGVRDGEIWELSWTVAPDSRRRGYGTAIVQAAVEQLRAEGAGSRIVAEIKTENNPSKKIARRAGFECQTRKGGIEHWAQEL